jgi:mono/diheme cytochrome c family protein
MKRAPLVAIVFILGVVIACDVPTPLAPAPPIGEVPNWGADFATPTEQPGGSMLGVTPPAGTGMIGNTNVPEGTAKPGDTGDWAGGDATLGKGVWVAMCARCHGESGEGGMQPGGVKVPPLNDPTVQAQLTDKQMARSIAVGKGAMPSFMRDLDRDKLAGVIAHIRSLKK